MFLLLEIYSTTLMHFSRYPKKMNYFIGVYSLLTLTVYTAYTKEKFKNLLLKRSHKLLANNLRSFYPAMQTLPIWRSKLCSGGFLQMTSAGAVKLRNRNKFSFALYNSQCSVLVIRGRRCDFSLSDILNRAF